MANGELGKLSPEQIQKLAGAISEAKDLTSQQEEIIKRVLEGEIEIGNTRMASLEKYFDSYSRNLDMVARKHSSLNDAFLILDNKLTENYKALSSDMTKLERQLKEAAEDSREKVQEAGAQERASKGTKKASTTVSLDTDTTKAIKQIAKALSQRPEPSGIIGYTPSDSGSSKGKRKKNNKGSSSTSSTTDLANAISAGQTVPDTARAGMSEPVEAVNKVSTEQVISDNTRTELTPAINIFEEISALEQAQVAVTNLNEAKKAGDKARTKEARAAYNEQKELWHGHLDKLKAKNKEHLEALARQESIAREKYLELELAKGQTQEQQATRLTEVRLRELDKVLDAELKAQEFSNQLKADIAYANSPEAVDFKVREENAKARLTEDKKQAEAIAKFTAERELYYKQKNGGVLTKAAAEQVQKELKEKLENQKKNENNLSKERERLAKIEYQKLQAEKDSTRRAGIDAVVAEGATLAERKQALYELTHDENGNFDTKETLAVAVTAMDKVAHNLGSLAKQLDNSIDKIASYKGDIDTRLQGSSNERSSGSYWDQLTKDMMSVGAVTPFFRQEDFANNIRSLVDRGIAFDLKQRAFLMTIQEKIANTFDVADGTLLRLVRIQQEDSTAGRLGMESALNSFLNEMYENTEYLKDVAASVRGSLQEMESLMGGAEATEVEYQVQKWMGSLYSVGMSQEAVNSIATAFGQIAAGQIEALTNGGTGNLLVMAANEAGLPISDILSNGLTAKDTNKLLQATVNYLADIAESSKDNKVVQQQLANVFGVKASDLRAATNLATNSTVDNIYGEYLTYDNMLKQLNTMAGSMVSRTSIGEMMSNVWANGEYTLASSMANSPVAYLTYKLASLLDSTVGGIAIPAMSVMGNMVDLETTVADLMRVAAVGTGILGSLGPMISGLSSSFSGQAMLSKMGIESGSSLKITPRGTGSGIEASDIGLSGGVQTTSGSGYIGNASSSDIKNSTMQGAEDTKKQHMIEAVEEAEATQVDFINANVLKIYELLDEVASGKRNFTVKVAGYGLTNLGSNTSLSSAQGGVAGLLNNNAASSSSDSLAGGFSSGSSGGSSSGSSNSGSAGSSGNFSLSSGVNLGGWSAT